MQDHIQDGNTKQIPDYVRLWLKHINIYTTEKNQLLKVFMQDLNVESLLLNCRGLMQYPLDHRWNIFIQQMRC